MDNLSCYNRDIFGAALFSPSLPKDYEPVRPAFFEVERIYLARGSIATAERKRFVERICALYPEAPVEERLPELLALLSLRLLPLRLQVLLPGRDPRRKVLALSQDICQPARDAGGN